MKKIMILVSVIFLMCTGIWFRFHTKECRVVSDLAYDKNKKGDHLVYIREGHELVPFLVLTSDYNGETLLLRKEVLKMNMQINSYEAYYENSFMEYALFVSLRMGKYASGISTGLERDGKELVRYQ